MSPLGIMKLAVAVLLMQFCRQSVQYPRCDEDHREFGREKRYICRCQETRACDFHQNGKCISGGCVSGYHGPNCQRKSNKRCFTGWFGPECTKQCQCLNYGKCHQTTGRCDNGCLPGRHGDDCQQLNYDNIAVGKKAYMSSMDNYTTNFYINGTCREGHFLPEAHLAVDGIYDPDLDHQSCADTKQGKNYWSVYLANNYTISHIRVFNRDIRRWRLEGVKVYVGSKKEPKTHICHTLGDEHADAIIDIICKRPITGDTVTIYQPNNRFFTLCEVEVLQCKEGYFGKSCREICHCLDNIKCDRTIGHCSTGCAPGYTGVNCQTECMDGYFGKGCKEICHCLDISRCNRITGICSTGCAPGYTGVNCQTECTDGYFGKNCKSICNCLDNSTCGSVTGNCPTDCAPGYYRDNCQTECSYGTFGFKCSGICKCNNNTLCDIVHGECEDGQCSPWYTGRACQEALLLVVGAPAMIFVILLGTIIGAIVWYRKKKTVKMVVNPNGYLELQDIPLNEGEHTKPNHKAIDADNQENIYDQYIEPEDITSPENMYENPIGIDIHLQDVQCRIPNRGTTNANDQEPNYIEITDSENKYADMSCLGGGQVKATAAIDNPEDNYAVCPG